MSGFTRQTTGGTFIAYTKEPSRKPVSILVGDDVEQVRVHSEVYVQEYTSIKVKNLTPAERGNGLRVEFDPASVPVPEGRKPLSKAISTNTEAGGAIEEALRWAMTHDAALYVGLEYRRKYKTPDGDVIPYDTPILELKGFDADGKATRESQGTSLLNISKVLAVIGRVDKPESTLISGEVQSDPLTWQDHRDNRTGTTPAEGWVRITRPDGTPGGAAITRDTWRELKGTAQTATSGLSSDQLNELADLVAARVAPVSDPTITRPPQRSARSAEARRWDAYNSDGRVNPGSYAVTAAVAARNTALTVLEGVNFGEAQAAADEGREPNLLTQSEISTRATRLMGALSSVTDAVQQAMTGMRPNRTDGSHSVAGRVLAQVATRELPMTREIFDDVDASRAWLNDLQQAAIDVASAALSVTATHLEAVADPTPVGDASGRAQREVERQNAPQMQRGQTTSGPQVAANRSIEEPPAPNFGTSDSPVESIKARNVATIKPLLELAKLQPADVMPLLRQQFDCAAIDQINPENLAATVQAWTQDPSRFREAARAAFDRATTTEAAS
ncbi:hypothetical protein [Gordonia alkanivorans]|uniref:hypothetical protein n=1 Tax=Gordonia alkanivorans TaxID=84096 RepID=UPI0004BAD38A|nr:hypothetical protein [Gordonia alkanivorans]